MNDGLTSLIGPVVPVSPEHVAVEWEAASAIVPAEAARFIEDRWRIYEAEAKEAGRTLFNGAITRLISARMESGGAKIVLRVGPADYKTFLVTCMRDGAWFEAHAPGAIAAALGNSVLLTHGRRALLGIRSERVSAYPGRGHLFGGVAELLGTEKFPASAAGLVAHLELELHEEAGIGRAELAPEGPRILGLAVDRFLRQPELFWQWETTVELELLMEKLDVAEHSGALLLDRGNIRDTALENLTPVARHVVKKWAEQT